MNWPARGVYFFHESAERRARSGYGPRVTHVGTHAITRRAKTTLWNRLYDHRGPERRVGGHAGGSIFRSLVGDALAWKLFGSSWRETNIAAVEIEALVSRHICAMPFLWLNVDDTPGPDSLRSFIKRNAVALLSGYCEPALDPPSQDWLGSRVGPDHYLVRASGLWNQKHVDQPYAPSFLDEMEKRVNKTKSP